MTLELTNIDDICAVVQEKLQKKWDTRLSHCMKKLLLSQGRDSMTDWGHDNGSSGLQLPGPKGTRRGMSHEERKLKSNTPQEKCALRSL